METPEASTFEDGLTFKQTLAKDAIVSAAATAGGFLALMAGGYVYVKLQERREAKKAPKLTSVAE